MITHVHGAMRTLVHHRVRIMPATGSGRGTAIVSAITISPSTLFATNRDADPEVELYVSSAPGQAVAVYDDVATTVIEVARITTPGFPNAVGADFDGDGHFDIAIGINYPTSRMDVYFGNADESYDAPVSLPADDPRVLRVGDVDEDGLPDFVAGNVKTDNTWPDGTVSVYRNEGARTFTHSALFVDKPGRKGLIWTVLLQDMSGDGHLDLIASSGQHTSTFIGVGDGQFRTPSILTAILDDPYNPIHASAIGAGDFDGDDRSDLMIGGHRPIYPFTSACSTYVDLHTISPVISVGQEATLHVQVSGFASDTPAPRGTITLNDGATIIGTQLVDAIGRASFSLSGLTLGDHPLTAEFSGNAHIPAGTSTVVTQTVKTETTETTMTLPAEPRIYGQPFPIQITVTGAGHSWVTVNLDGVEFEHHTGSPLNVSLEPGNHTISATFFGDTYWPPSETETVPFSISKASSNIVGVGGLLSVRAGSPHVLTYNVNGGGAAPSGSLQLIEGNTPIANATLANGSATFNVTLTRGAHDVRIVYPGDSRYLPSEQSVTMEVLANLPFVMEARALPGGVHIAYVLPSNTNFSTLQLLRRQAGALNWSTATWNPGTGMDTSLVGAQGVVYEYMLTAQLNNGSPVSSNMDPAMPFSDDLLTSGTRVKSKHFTELRTAVNLWRAHAGLAPFQFSHTVTAAALIRASHIAELRAALTEARAMLAMTTPAFTGAGAGTTILASHVQEIRELAR